MTTGHVAQVLGLSVDRIKQLDDQLKPIRTQSGHRRYDPDVVTRVLKQRKQEGIGK